MREALWCVDDGAVRWWVGAKDESDAVKVVLEHEGFAAIDPPGVTAQTEEMARQTVYHHPLGGTTSMWEEWQRNQCRRLVACSEW